jgi:hypothetical protein
MVNPITVNFYKHIGDEKPEETVTFKCETDEEFGKQISERANGREFDFVVP